MVSRDQLDILRGNPIIALLRVNVPGGKAAILLRESLIAILLYPNAPGGNAAFILIILRHILMLTSQVFLFPINTERVGRTHARGFDRTPRIS